METKTKREEEPHVYYVKVTGTNFERLKKIMEQHDKNRKKTNERVREKYSLTPKKPIHKDTTLELVDIEQLVKEYTDKS